MVPAFELRTGGGGLSLDPPFNLSRPVVPVVQTPSIIKLIARYEEKGRGSFRIWFGTLVNIVRKDGLGPIHQPPPPTPT